MVTLGYDCLFILPVYILVQKWLCDLTFYFGIQGVVGILSWLELGLCQNC